MPSPVRRAWREPSEEMAGVWQRAMFCCRRTCYSAPISARHLTTTDSQVWPDRSRRHDGRRDLSRSTSHREARREKGFITQHFTPAGERMYFTPENGERIDGARHMLHDWRQTGTVDDDVYYALLAALIEGADRVANTTGVYASYVKQWQPNALKPLTIDPDFGEPGPPAEALHADAISAAEELADLDLLYIDPPYNTRQYVAYYHIPEIIARGWFDGAVPSLRGKVGLLADSGGRSNWSHGRRVKGLFRQLLQKTTARHVLVSFNSEGHLSEPDLLEVLRAAAVDQRTEQFACGYRRYRADRDRAGRRYSSDTVQEHLYYARLR
jgi:adenine-specific DNA-methyltransferase